MNAFPRLHHTAAILLALFAFGLSAILSRTVFERLPHLEDEMTYLFQARMLARGQLTIETPLPRRAYWQPFVIDYQGQRFGKYPLGWPLLLAAGDAAGAAWLVNAALAALTVALVYRFGRALFGTDAGVIAAALLAFSPMALLLNATLMSHTSALLLALLFMFACWQSERSRRPRRWGLVAGTALGLLVINRPLAAAALALPFAIGFGFRLIAAGLKAAPGRGLKAQLEPLLLLSAAALLVGLLLPLQQMISTGDPRQNLYELVWPYDRVGFGEGYGRNGHTLEKGLRQARWDLSLTAADLFGWTAAPVTDGSGALRPDLRDHLLSQATYLPVTGLSWLPLLAGLLVGLRRWPAALLWLLAGAVAALLLPTLPVEAQQNPAVGYLWLLLAAGWVGLPLALSALGKRDHQARWIWLLLAVCVSAVALHMAYWVGSQRYSTRYYYEALAAAALIGALPLAALARRWRAPVYAALLILLLVSLFGYSLPRIGTLYRYNWISPALVEAVNARRQTDRPALVIVTGDDIRWRAYGSLMAHTSPFLDSDIVAAMNYADGVRQQILDRFPEREVIELYAARNRACFSVDMTTDCYGAPPEE